jgi:hypothetical protein
LAAKEDGGILGPAALGLKDQGSALDIEKEIRLIVLLGDLFGFGHGHILAHKEFLVPVALFVMGCVRMLDPLFGAAARGKDKTREQYGQEFGVTFHGFLLIVDLGWGLFSPRLLGQEGEADLPFGFLLFFDAEPASGVAAGPAIAARLDMLVAHIFEFGFVADVPVLKSFGVAYATKVFAGDTDLPFDIDAAADAIDAALLVFGVAGDVATGFALELVHCGKVIFVMTGEMPVHGRASIFGKHRKFFG